MGPAIVAGGGDMTKFKIKLQQKCHIPGSAAYNHIDPLH
jgi:hypothetical protein